VASIEKRTTDYGMGSELRWDVKSRTFGEGGIEAMATHRRLSVD
jgi:hypothetical protein